MSSCLNLVHWVQWGCTEFCPKRSKSYSHLCNHFAASTTQLEDKLSCAGQDKIDCDDDLLEDAIEGEFFRWSGRCPFDAAELAMHKGCCDVVLNFSVK